MASQVLPAESDVHASPVIVERPASRLSGITILALGIATLIAGIVVLWLAAKHTAGVTTALNWAGAALLIIGSLELAGLTPIAPGKARVVQLFGRYRGTMRESSLQWVNPFTRRIAVSTRIRNLESAQAKVNDADGNPIEIAAVGVWQVADTASAVYSVDNYTQFVTIQTETAVRHISSSYPYTSRRGAELALRGSADDITNRRAVGSAAPV